MATGTAKVRGGELFYDVEGDGRTVVLLHGGMLDHTLWDEQVPLLVGAGYRTVRYDARWHGPLKGFGINVGKGSFKGSDVKSGAVWLDDIEGMVVLSPGRDQ